ncbi:DUF2142 domain-containing protein [Roseburia sp. NSJ-9]|uniref:DUF2142 domain-containing protein n=1 Tax=Roseburia lenta TaxID=2763061 RepID=A0ABR7GGV7_9FIRM|nr:DUF2142 domain-containing protein [Roseburia lenta]MBC5686679.1 DUF2142 domain-containing protein [Roseburia lenta]
MDFSNQLEVYYYGNNSSSYQGEMAQTFWDTGSGYSEEKSSFYSVFKRLAVFPYKNEGQGLQSVRVDFSASDEEIGIARIQVRSGMFATYTISGADLARSALWQNCSLQVEDDHVWITPTSGDPYLVLDQNNAPDFMARLQSDRWCKIGLLALFIVSLFLLAGLEIWLKPEKSDRVYKLFSWLSIAIVIAVFVMSLFSITYGHPDEDETRGSVDYYLTHWGLPDFDDISLQNAYSNYGTIRLAERSFYYILAGKFGWIGKNIFHISAYYRMFNVLLLVLLVAWILIKGRKDKWMFAFLFATPQLWYLFSYATSDAWDIFIGFFVVTEAIREDGLIAGVWKEGFSWRQFGGMFLYAFLCAQTLMGKKNYLIILLFAFVVLLFKLWDAENKKQLFLKYMMILGMVFGFYAIRAGIDLWRYPEGKGYLYRAEHLKHQSQEIVEMQSLKQQGYTYLQTLTAIDDGLFPTMFNSFVGRYGWMSLYSANIYVYIMLVLYIVNIVSTWRACKERKHIVAIVVTISFLCVGTVYQMWTQDYQAQGRYMLPCILGEVYLLSDSQVWEKKTYTVSQTLIVGAGMLSFVVWGIIPLCLELVH